MSEERPPRRKESERLHRRLLLSSAVLIVAAGLLVFVLIMLHGSYTKAQPEQTEPPSTEQSTGGSATLCAVGDICLSEAQLRNLHNADGSYQFSDCFSQVMARLAAADLTVGNLEGNVCGEPCDAAAYNYPPALLTALNECGFDILQTANSRSIQNGISGLKSTISEIRAANMASVGTYASAEEAAQSGGVLLREVNGIRFAFIAFTKGLNGMSLPAGSEYSVDMLYSDYNSTYSEINETAIVARIDAALAQSPDVVVAMVHWGTENSDRVTDSQQRIAELLLEHGVHVILGTHSHQVGALERQGNNGFIAYSLGDFLTVSEDDEAQYGCILSLRFEKDASGAVSITDATYAPTYTASPSREYGVSHYAVLDTEKAIALYESQFYGRVKQAFYERLLSTVDALKEQTAALED